MNRERAGRRKRAMSKGVLKRPAGLLIDGKNPLSVEFEQLRKDARETICGARRILANDSLPDDAKVKSLKNHFSTARALLLVWEPASPAICRALDAAVEAHKEP